MLNIYQECFDYVIVFANVFCIPLDDWQCNVRVYDDKDFKVRIIKNKQTIITQLVCAIKGIFVEYIDQLAKTR